MDICGSGEQPYFGSRWKMFAELQTHDLILPAPPPPPRF